MINTNSSPRRPTAWFVMALVVAATLVWSTVAGATSYVMPTDQNLLDKSSLVVVGTIEAKQAAPQGDNPATDYQVRVEQVLKGFLLATDIVVRVPGGPTSDGRMSFAVHGAPRFASGSRAILFLNERDGAFEVADLSLGAFLEAGIGSSRYVYRNISATEFTSDRDPLAAERRRSHLPRDFQRFTVWLAERAAGSTREADYFLEESRDLVGTREEFDQVVFGCPDGDAIGRWTQFDNGQSRTYRAFSGGQPGVPGGGFAELQRGIAAWDGVPNTTVDLRYGGETGSSLGGTEGTANNELSIIPNDPNNLIPGTFTAGQGGVLAQTNLFTLCNPVGTHMGLAWVPIFDADIIGQDGLDTGFFPFQMSGPLAYERVMTHEVGHGIGMGHSCGDNGFACTGARGAAIMRAFYQDSLEGSNLAPDDRAGLQFLYGSGNNGGGSTPTAPSGLTASPLSQTEIQLGWTDNADNETSFLIQERGISSTIWSDLATLGANTTSVTVEGIPSSTARVYRVAAVNGNGTSDFSNEAQATTNAPIEPCVSDEHTLCLRNDRFKVTTLWLTTFGTNGQGDRVDLTEDTGYFTFFNPDNVEAVVKVLEFCADPFNSYWVFAGGLTNVQVELTVTDTQTGDVKTYFNGLDTPFQPIQDTAAFDTCP